MWNQKSRLWWRQTAYRNLFFIWRFISDNICSLMSWSGLRLFRLTAQGSNNCRGCWILVKIGGVVLRVYLLHRMQVYVLVCHYVGVEARFMVMEWRLGQTKAEKEEKWEGWRERDVEKFWRINYHVNSKLKADQRLYRVNVFFSSLFSFFVFLHTPSCSCSTKGLMVLLDLFAPV